MNSSNFYRTSLDGDPEAIVQSLIGQQPPGQQLATYELTTAEEVMKPIFAFALTCNENPFEREELIDFVRGNEHLLRNGGMATLADIQGTMSAHQGYSPSPTS